MDKHIHTHTQFIQVVLAKRAEVRGIVLIADEEGFASDGAPAVSCTISEYAGNVCVCVCVCVCVSACGYCPNMKDPSQRTYHSACVCIHTSYTCLYILR